jgi:ubiquinone/menaquinone biosynthesis C-methylase UbiE
VPEAHWRSLDKPETVVRSDAEWKVWGAQDPLYAVASWSGKDRSGAEPWTPAEFLALGRADMTDVLSHWRHYGLTPGRCVEVGCGAGRMTGILAEAFGSVLALDVSPDQIAVARQHLAGLGDRIEFEVVERPGIPAPRDSCNGMFSCHVFQHFSEFAGVPAYLIEAFRVLRPGGTICFHIPVLGAHLGSTQSSARLELRNLRAKVGRRLHMGKKWEYHRYDARRIITLLMQTGFRDVELRIFPMHSNGDHHSYFFGRRA